MEEDPVSTAAPSTFHYAELGLTGAACPRTRKLTRGAPPGLRAQSQPLLSLPGVHNATGRYRGMQMRLLASWRHPAPGQLPSCCQAASELPAKRSSQADHQQTNDARVSTLHAPHRLSMTKASVRRSSRGVLKKLLKKNCF